jgi:hypothetical protein
MRYHEGVTLGVILATNFAESKPFTSEEEGLAQVRKMHNLRHLLAKDLAAVEKVFLKCIV